MSHNDFKNMNIQSNIFNMDFCKHIKITDKVLESFSKIFSAEYQFFYTYDLLQKYNKLPTELKLDPKSN